MDSFGKLQTICHFKHDSIGIYRGACYASLYQIWIGVCLSQVRKRFHKRARRFNFFIDLILAALPVKLLFQDRQFLLNRIVLGNKKGRVNTPICPETNKRMTLRQKVRNLLMVRGNIRRQKATSLPDYFEVLAIAFQNSMGIVS